MNLQPLSQVAWGGWCPPPGDPALVPSQSAAGSQASCDKGRPHALGHFPISLRSGSGRLPYYKVTSCGWKETQASWVRDKEVFDSGTSKR